MIAQSLLLQMTVQMVSIVLDVALLRYLHTVMDVEGVGVGLGTILASGIAEGEKIASSPNILFREQMRTIGIDQIENVLVHALRWITMLVRRDV